MAPPDSSLHPPSPCPPHVWLPCPSSCPLSFAHFRSPQRDAQVHLLTTRGAGPAASEGGEQREAAGQRPEGRLKRNRGSPRQMPLCSSRPIVTGHGPALPAGGLNGWGGFPTSCPLCSPVPARPGLGQERAGVFPVEWRVWKASKSWGGRGALS